MTRHRHRTLQWRHLDRTQTALACNDIFSSSSAIPTVGTSKHHAKSYLLRPLLRLHNIQAPLRFCPTTKYRILGLLPPSTIVLLHSGASEQPLGKVQE